MAILAISSSLEELRSRIEDLVVAYDTKGYPITTLDLGKWMSTSSR
jgi:formyltetrahydrofolate synthetase